nr:MAG TPA: ATP dependent DNA helicase [Caudoviricetes sp.]
MSKEEKEYKFSGKVVRCTYDTPDFRIFALDVDSKKYPDIKKNKYNNVTILGELHELTVGVTYEISAVEQLGKYGMSYKVLNIKRDVPTTEEDMYLFLSEILTPNQAKVLYENYPDIVQRVKENRLDDIDFNKLKGIKEYTFGVIKRKIIENFCLADLVVEFQGFLNLSMIKKIYAKYTSIEKLKEKLAQDPYKCLCGLAGVGFKTADGILLDMEKASKVNIEKGKKPIIEFKSDLRTSPERCLSCLLYMLEENENNGHTKMNLADLRAEMMKLVPACANHFVTAVKADEIHYNKDTMDVALSRTYNLEHKIAQTILYVLHTKKDEWDCDIEKYRTVNGSTLSDEQMGAVANVCKYPISILNGAGGTGKSFSTQAVINMLKDHHKTFRLFSPTGKAAKVLADYTKENATTIHRGLGYTPMGWGYNQEHKIMCDIVIIDEFSMVDIQLFKRVIDAVDFNTTKLLLIGDNAQLPSVSCGNLLHDFMETKLIPTTTLTKVFRYGEGGLMKVATDVRFCEPYLTSSMKSKMTTFGDNKDYTFVDLPSEVIPQNVVGLYKKLLEKGYSIDDIQVLTAKNVGDCGTVVLNNMIQKVANPNYGSEVFMKVGDTTYFEGDLVIQKVNNYKAELDLQHLSEWEKDMYSVSEDIPTAFIANGETGIVREIYKSYCIIEFDGVFVKYYRADMQMISLGYSITIHKSQGSSIKIVILCTPQSHIYMLNSNLLYVGLTRMKEGCYHLGALNSINQAVKKKANLTRHTHMQELLLTMPEEEYMALEKSEKKKPEIDGTEEDTEELPWI